MSDAVLVVLIPTIGTVIVALVGVVVALIVSVKGDIRKVSISVDGQLTALKEAIARANLAEGQLQGADAARASDRLERLARADAAALVLAPLVPPVTQQVEVVNADPVVVKIATPEE